MGGYDFFYNRKVFFDTSLRFLAFLFLGSDLKPSTGWFEPMADSIVQWTIEGIQGILKASEM